MFIIIVTASVLFVIVIFEIFVKLQLLLSILFFLLLMFCYLPIIYLLFTLAYYLLFLCAKVFFSSSSRHAAFQEAIQVSKFGI